MQEEVLETTLNENNILETELSDSKVLETEVTAIQKDIELDHSKLDNLDYESSGHTGFQPAGNYVEDVNYVHTDNNYTIEEKTKLSNLENYDDTEIKRDIQSLEDTKVDREVNKGLSTNDYTNEEKTKLASLENYDDTEVKANIISLQANKANRSEIPDVSNFITNTVDDLVNYYKKSETYTQSEVNALISAITTIRIEAVDELPVTGQSNIIYLVPSTDPQTQNIKDEYIWVNNAWEKIGSTEIDLSNYVTTTQLNTALADYTTTANLTTLLAGKQNTIDSTHKLNADLVDDTNATNKFVTASEKTAWNNKQDMLVSGTNIKTINNESILGSGNINISGSTGLFQAEYGVTTLAEIQQAIANNNIVYCKVDSRYAFLAYGSENNYEFQYYRSVTSHNISNRDQVFVYKITSSGWTTTTRYTEIGIVAGTGISFTSATNERVTISVNTDTIATKQYVDDIVGDINTALSSLVTVGGNE